MRPTPKGCGFYGLLDNGKLRRSTALECVNCLGLRIINRDDLIKTTDSDNIEDWTRKGTISKLLARCVKFPGKVQKNPNPRTADERYLLSVQDQCLISRINSGFQDTLKSRGTDTVNRTTGHCNQDPVFSLPLNIYQYFGQFLAVEGSLKSTS